MVPALAHLPKMQLVPQILVVVLTSVATMEHVVLIMEIRVNILLIVVVVIVFPMYALLLH